MRPAGRTSFFVSQLPVGTGVPSLTNSTTAAMPSTNRAHQSRKARDLTANPRRDSRSSTPPIARESRKHPPQMVHPSWPCPQGSPKGGEGGDQQGGPEQLLAEQPAVQVGELLRIIPEQPARQRIAARRGAEDPPQQIDDQIGPRHGQDGQEVASPPAPASLRLPLRPEEGVGLLCGSAPHCRGIQQAAGGGAQQLRQPVEVLRAGGGLADIT